MNYESPEVNDEEKPGGIPAHDRVLIEALREQELTFGIQEAWREEESARNRPLPEQVMALRKLLPSGVNLSDEELAAFRMSREYQGATILNESGVMRPEDTACLDEEEIWTAAYSLASQELDFYSRTKLMHKQKWITGLAMAWAIGGTTAEATYNAALYGQPFWSSVKLLPLVIVVPVFTFLWWLVTKVVCKEYITGLRERASRTAARRGRDKSET